MEFNYVVGWYSRKTMQVKPLGGFLDIKSAKEFSDFKDTLFWGEGFLCIDSPEGIYINGYEKYSDVHPKWFTPEEVSKKDIRVFSSSKDKNMLLDEFLPYDDYKKFTGNGKLFQTTHKKGDTISGKVEKTDDVVNRESVIKKISDNKRILDAKATAQKDMPLQEKSEKYHENPER